MKKHLLKTWLFSALMVLGAGSAWADEITATLVHTSSSGVPSATAGAYVSTIDAEQEYINNSAFGNKNWQGAAYADFSFEIPADQSIMKATLTWSGIGSGKNRTTDLMYVNAGLSLDYSEEGLGSGTAEVNLAATKIETVTFPANTTTQFTSDVTDAVKTIAASQAYIIFKFTNNIGAGNLVGKGAASGAPVLVITTQDASSTTSYTVKFVDEGGNELKAAAEHTGVIKGTTVSATAEETASFYSEDNSKKYIYVSGNSETVVADDGSTVITLVFREAAVYNYSVKTSLGATISEGTAFEGDNITYYFPQYQVVDGTLYETAKNNNMLRNTTTADTDNKEIVVNYTATETTGVVFLTEAEDIEGALSTMGGNADIRCSMGTGAYFESDATVTTLAPGKYKLTAQVWGNATTTFAIKVGDATVLSIDTKGYIYQETSDEFEVTESSDVTIPAVGNANRVLDLLYIVKTGEVAAENQATILANIAALKAFEPTESGTVKVTLDNVKVTYAGVLEDEYYGNTENVVLEDASGADLLQNKGIADKLKAGDVLNGELVLTVEVDEKWGDVTYTASLDNVTITEGELAPMEVTEDNLMEYLGDYSWRLVKFTGATISIVSGDWSDDIMATIPVMGEDAIGLQDTFGTITEWPADGDVVDIVGYYVSYSYYGLEMQYIQPISITKVSDLMKEAMTLAADADAVAVGKLLAAIEEAKADPANEETILTAAIEQFKADNADQEKDETAKVATNGWKKYDGTAAGVCATQFAPAIDTYDGRTNVQLAEVYEGSTDGVNRTGTIIYQDITGLTNGTYKVGFYGNAFYTSGRGFDSPMADGAEDVAYVFANDQKAFIVANIATSTTENNFRQFDVEVTDGTIKLGMGKELAGTNWHTMQIYQLTWFTTAKEVYAADKAEMQAALDAAKEMTGNNGKDAFDEAVAAAEAALANNCLNLDEFEAEIAKFKEAVKAYKLANIVIPEGKYYLVAMSLEDDNLMAAGKSWGTQGIVNGQGLDLNFIYNIDTDNYNIETNIYNGNSHFLGSNLYMDSGAFGWNIEEDEVYGHCIFAMIDNVKQYIGVSTLNTLELTTEPFAWAFIDAEWWEALVKEEGLAALEEASENNGVDATFLLKDANFNRNDHRWDAWEVNADCTNKNLGGGCDGSDGNGCAESYHSTFTISQVAADAPKGTYELTAQGFYRQDDGVVEAAPQFFLNGVYADVPVKDGSENSMTDASYSFSAGNYAIEPIKVFINDGETLTVGLTNNGNVHQWVIFDNFRLTYYGEKNLTTGISEVNTTAEAANAIYNLQGQKLQKTVKGLNIIGGKKIFVK